VKQSCVMSVIAAVGCLTAHTWAQDQVKQPETKPETKPQVAPERPYHAMEMIRREAARLRRTVKHDSTRMFLFAASWLPVVETRTVMYNPETEDAISMAEFNSRPEQMRKGYEELKLDDKFYYFTRYGSPAAYSRAVDIVAEQAPGVKNWFKGKKVLDYGFGGIGHLRLMALLGADVTGVEVDPVLKALYSDPIDTGTVAAASSMGDDVQDGNLRLLFGSWPKELNEQAGGGYDLFLSKNTLKKGYVHPAQPIPDRQRLQLGVTDEEFVRAMSGMLKPGGFALIYNLHPKQNAEKYIPWADGASPFTRDAFEAAGFEVIAFDQNDSAEAREMGRQLKWNEGESAMDLDNDLFATYTLLRKKAE